MDEVIGKAKEGGQRGDDLVAGLEVPTNPMPLWVGWRRHRRAARRPGVRPHRTRYGAILRAGLLVAPARARAFHHGRGSRRRLAGSAGIEAQALFVRWSNF
jgi:hypothetical protein